MADEKEYPNLKHFTSTNQPANRGAKPSYLKRYVKYNSVSTKDMRLMLGGIVHQYNTIDKMKIGMKNPKTPSIVVLFLTAMLKDMTKGKTDSLQFLINYGYGMPKIEIETHNENITTDISHEERQQRIDELLMKRNLEIEDKTDEKDRD